MGYGWDILAPANITRIIQETQDQLTLPMPLVWLERAAKVNASDDELTMQETSHVFAADIIAADSRALIRDSGSFNFFQHQIAKLKHGFGISESQVQLLRRIEANRAMDNEKISFTNYIARRAKELLLGIEQRQEAMLNGMLMDSFDYDRLGIKLSGTFGMKQDLKFNPVAAWTSTSTAKPVRDLMNAIVYARRHYGEVYNRITMSYEALTNLVATDEFKDVYKANVFTWSAPTAGFDATVAANPGFYVGFLQNFISAGIASQGAGGGPILIELDEGQYREASSASTIAGTQRFHPENVIYFTNSGDDGQSSGWDWGNGEVMEVVIGRMGGTGVIGEFTTEGYGPVGYATQADPNLNPPGLVMWAVARGGPRKHRDTCSAKLTAW